MLLILATAVLAAAAAPGLAPPAAPPPACGADGGFLTARLRGSIDVEIDWRGAELECAGMSRPDGLGIRLRFAGTLADGRHLAIVFAPPRLAEGAHARAVAVNVTVLDESGEDVYGTLGEERCLLDEVEQRRLADPAGGGRAWAVQGRGFCTAPARSLAGDGAVLLTRFDFLGQVVFRDDAPLLPAAADEAAP